MLLASAVKVRPRRRRLGFRGGRRCRRRTVIQAEAQDLVLDGAGAVKTPRNRSRRARPAGLSSAPWGPWR